MVVPFSVTDVNHVEKSLIQLTRTVKRQGN